MKEIQLTRGLCALVDDADFDELNKYKWHAAKSPNTFYAVRVQDKTRISMHRHLLSPANNKLFVDHKDRNGLNNQRSNLRIATHSQNMSNSAAVKNTSSKYKGVHFDNKIKKWNAHIQKDKKVINLGVYKLEDDAARAYNLAAIKMHGEFAFLNDVDMSITPIRNEKGGDNHPLRIISRVQANEIREIYAKGNITQQKIADMFGIKQITVSAIITRKIWK